MLKDQIKDAVGAHYASSKDPYLLSALGKALRDEGIWPSLEETRTLKQLLKSLEPDLLLIADENSPSFEAVVTPEFEHVVRKAIQDRTSLRSLAKFPRSLVLAFCAKVDGEEKIYLNSASPFDYVRATDDPGHDYKIVDEEYRKPGLYVSNLNKLDPSDADALRDGIERWLKDSGLDSSDFRKARGEIFKPGHVPTSGSTALERLIAAQPEGLASQMVIPLDIALLLSRGS